MLKSFATPLKLLRLKSDHAAFLLEVCGEFTAVARQQHDKKNKIKKYSTRFSWAEEICLMAAISQIIVIRVERSQQKILFHDSDFLLRCHDTTEQMNNVDNNQGACCFI